ncbi:Structure-specific endonuclease subunit SLX4 [Entamoeba marina]
MNVNQSPQICNASQIEISDEVCEIHDDKSDTDCISAILNNPVFKVNSPDVVCIGSSSPERNVVDNNFIPLNHTSPTHSLQNNTFNRDVLTQNNIHETQKSEQMNENTNENHAQSAQIHDTPHLNNEERTPKNFSLLEAVSNGTNVFPQYDEQEEQRLWEVNPIEKKQSPFNEIIEVIDSNAPTQKVNQPEEDDISPIQTIMDNNNDISLSHLHLEQNMESNNKNYQHIPTDGDIPLNPNESTHFDFNNESFHYEEIDGCSSSSCCDLNIENSSFSVESYEKERKDDNDSCEEKILFNQNQYQNFSLPIDVSSQHHALNERDSDAQIHNFPSQQLLSHSSFLLRPTFRVQQNGNTPLPSQQMPSQIPSQTSSLPSQCVFCPPKKSQPIQVINSQTTLSQQPNFFQRKLAVYEWFDKEIIALTKEKERRLRQVEMEQNAVEFHQQTSSQQQRNTMNGVNTHKQIANQNLMVSPQIDRTRKQQIRPTLTQTNENQINKRRNKQTKLKHFTTTLEVSNWIRGHSIYEDILLFNAVDLDDVVKIMRDNGYYITKKFLRQYFSKNCVNYADASRTRQNRRGAGNF